MYRTYLYDNMRQINEKSYALDEGGEKNWTIAVANRNEQPNWLYSTAIVRFLPAAR